MIRYLAGRLVTMAWTLLAISVLVFVIIQLPPGDYLTSYIAEIQSQGEQ
ncbi:MAG: ABC transporter permease, partial [Aurantimonas coralicida]|nr:ABC transporter permease [Aurantimonas coralicida]